MSKEKKEDADDAEATRGGSRDRKDAFNRRGFFTEGLRNLLRPVGDIIEQRLDDFDRSGWSEPDHGSRPYPSSSSSADPEHEPPRPRAPTGQWLRPPGALPEKDFLETCVSSGQCVSACPVSAIHPTASSDSMLDGKPIIEARLKACVVCQDLACMKVCPTGALSQVEVEEIRMGTAEVQDDICVRSQGEDCQICVDKCPLGPRAIDIPSFGAEVTVLSDGCVGCGVCEHYCPTEPRAIVVNPREEIGGDA